MRMGERRVGSVTIVDLAEKIVENNCSSFEDRLNGLVAKGSKHLLLNFAGVPYIDGAALGSIVRTYTAATRAGSSVKFLKLTQRVRNLLEITKLTAIFEIFDDEATAVASFTK